MWHLGRKNRILQSVPKNTLHAPQEGAGTTSVLQVLHVSRSPFNSQMWLTKELLSQVKPSRGTGSCWANTGHNNPLCLPSLCSEQCDLCIKEHEAVLDQRCVQAGLFSKLRCGRVGKTENKLPFLAPTLIFLREAEPLQARGRGCKILYSVAKWAFREVRQDVKNVKMLKMRGFITRVTHHPCVSASRTLESVTQRYRMRVIT